MIRKGEKVTISNVHGIYDSYSDAVMVYGDSECREFWHYGRDSESLIESGENKLVYTVKAVFEHPRAQTDDFFKDKTLCLIVNKEHKACYLMSAECVEHYGCNMMTYRQLSEWLAKGYGECKNSLNNIANRIMYSEDDENNPVSHILIRKWDSDEWIEPTIINYQTNRPFVVGNIVSHNEFGTGEVKEVHSNYCVVKFDSMNKEMEIKNSYLTK